MDVFRMHGPAWEVFDTTGAFQYPGRWHSKGTRVVYTAEHASLAVLETLIHAGGRKIPPRALTRIHIPDGLPIESQPWKSESSMDMPDSQSFGDAWVREARTPVLRVPSIAVNRIESNFILNPRHPDFPQIQHDPPAEFVFDLRFFQTR
jgi:RES domain-containing protein